MAIIRLELNLRQAGILKDATEYWAEGLETALKNSDILRPETEKELEETRVLRDIIIETIESA